MQLIHTQTHALCDDFDAILPGDTGSTDDAGRLYDFTLAAQLESQAEEVDGDDPVSALHAALLRTAATKARVMGLVHAEDAWRLSDLN